MDELLSQAESGKLDLDNGYAELNKQKQRVNSKLNEAQNAIDQGRTALELGEKELAAGKAHREEAGSQEAEADVALEPDTLSVFILGFLLAP